jgi:hypothetical protein
MGQVPVKIVGKAVVGDYIVTSGNHDGLAIAVHPQDLPTVDFSKIIGVAWQSTPEDKEVDKSDISVEAFEELLNQNPEIVSQIFAQAKTELAKRGFELSKYPELARMMDNPTPYLKKLHKDPSSFQLLFNK